MKVLTLTINQFNTFVKNILDAEEFLSNICVYGEVTNFKMSGGHAYFDLKDETAMLSCVKFGASDLNIKNDKGDLSNWARQGVLLLNTVLTVVKDTPASHKNIGWEIFTDEVIKIINQKEEPVVFILWGNFARSKKKYITNPKHLIIESTHPSPFSCNNGFFGSKPFSRANSFLIKNGIKKIEW